MPTLPGKKSAAKKVAAPSKPAPPRRPRPAEDDDDADEAPRRPAKKAAAGGGTLRRPSKSAVQSGWDGADNQKGDPNFPQAPKVDKGASFYFKFIKAEMADGPLKDGPYAAVKVHWIDRKGKMSFMCPQTDDCPLCMLGDTPKFEARFNIALLGSEQPLLRTLNVGQQAAEEFKGYDKDRRTGPLSSKFYSRTRPTGAGGRWKTEVFKREADLREELDDLGLDLYVPTDAEIEALGRWTREDAERDVNWKELQDIADELSDDYEDD